MTSFKIMAFLAMLVVVLLPMTALGFHDDMSPALAPFYEKVCEEVDCGKGTCKADIKYPFSYICECNANWKRSLDDDVDEDLKFLPCIIPNCTLNYGSCQPAPPPVPEKEIPHNISFYDPCNWIYCGEGTCNRSSTYKHICQCNSGFSNLLNTSYFPCYSECTLGADCGRLGITVSRQASDNGSQATSFLPGKLHWMIILIISAAMAIWK
ncbi:hypothetical protein Dsin_024034 [Dipteronia sinensis]|uniref:Uncharacterized protein n=1 Tax=Dipteronia sinensis TaxID=43782 RepID=A0AAE0E1M6_9ROSI|nr:hypothetical protein Dsin_024034 [Dipteronia sinensis]